MRIRERYALLGEIYRQGLDRGVMASHECVCLHSSVGPYMSPKLFDFLEGLAQPSRCQMQK